MRRHCWAQVTAANIIKSPRNNRCGFDSLAKKLGGGITGKQLHEWYHGVGVMPSEKTWADSEAFDRMGSLFDVEVNLWRLHEGTPDVAELSSCHGSMGARKINILYTPNHFDVFQPRELMDEEQLLQFIESEWLLPKCVLKKIKKVSKEQRPGKKLNSAISVSFFLWATVRKTKQMITLSVVSERGRAADAPPRQQRNIRVCSVYERSGSGTAAT